MTTEQEAPPARRDGTDHAEEGRSRGRATGRFLLRLVRHEWTLASVGGLLLAVVLT